MRKHSEDADKTAVIGSDPTAKLPKIEEQNGDDANKKAAKKGVRPKDQAKKRILVAVGKARTGGLIATSEEDAEAIVSSAADGLYDDYEAGGPAPTREAFAERCGDKGIGIVVLDMKKDPFAKDAAGRKTVAVAVALVVAAGLGLGTWAFTNAPQQKGDQPAAVAHEKDDEDAESEAVDAGTVQFGIDAPNWGEDSSPFIAHITGESDAGEAVDFYHAVWADGSTDTVELDAGTYQVAWTSAINADGSIYRTPEEPTQVVVGETAGGKDSVGTAEGQDPSSSAEVEDGQQDGGAESSSEDAASGDAGQEGDAETPVIDADESFEQVPAEDVTQDDLDQILGDIEQAVGNGDETLSGDAGQGVIDSATGNASNNPNADQDKIDQAGQDASDNVGEQPQNPMSGGNDDGGSTSGSDGGSTSGSSSSGGSSSGSTGTGTTGGSGNSGSTSGGSSQSQPQHTHNWVAQTAQQWVQDSAAWSEQVWVQDSAAWTETVQTGSHIQCSCGQTFSGNSDWSAHNREVMLSTGTAHSYSVVPTYETVYHEATGHYETVNHEATGHYETVTTGYRCSSCGATR